MFEKVSTIERMAYLILASDDFNDPNISDSEIRDACLIAAAISNKKAYAEVLPDRMTPEGENYKTEAFADRARMFSDVADEWQADAANGKGFWADTFARK